MAQALTERQHEVLDVINGFISDSGIPPTNHELMKALGIKSNLGVRKHLQALDRKGHIHLHPNQARGIELINPPGIPVIGRVSAGAPIEAIEHVEKHVVWAQGLFKAKPDYLLRVRGYSMEDAGILDDDLIGIRKQTTADSGQIVVARIDDEVTVKEIAIDNGDVILIPHNKTLKPMRIPGENVVIEGVYTGGLIREN